MFESNYQCGYKVGAKFRPLIQKRLGHFTKINNISPSTLADLRASHPEYIAELQGISDGADVNIQLVFALNLFDIVEHGCSTVVIFKDDGIQIGHNEDTPHNGTTRSMGRVIDYTFPDKQFSAYTYLGELPGNAYGWNSSGIYFFVNSIRRPKGEKPTIVNPTPLYIMLRKMYEYTDIDSLLDYLGKVTVADMIHVTIVKDSKVYSVEKAYSQTSIQKIDQTFVHTNHFLHNSLYNVDEPNENSIVRFKTIKKLLDQGKNLHHILHHKGNHPYSIYGQAKSNSLTLSTVIIEL